MQYRSTYNLAIREEQWLVYNARGFIFNEPSLLALDFFFGGGGGGKHSNRNLRQ